MRLAIVASHPVQYQAPLFRELARFVDLHVYFAHRATPVDQAAAGFGVPFDWDVDLLEGYRSDFLDNVATSPGGGRFNGYDTPGIAEKLRQGRFDAVAVMGWFLKSYIQTIVASRRLGLPVLVRGDSQLGMPNGPLRAAAKGLIFPLGLRAFSAALYVGERSRAYYRRYGYPERQLFFSPHCIDTDWFAARSAPPARERMRDRLGIGENEPAILFAGKLAAFKRPLDLVAAAGRLPLTAPLHLIFAGAGPLEAEIRTAAAGQPFTLHMLGFKNQTELPEIYAGADVLCLPSDRTETWGLVANEALACGTPIVVSDAAGCSPDLTGDGAVGRSFPVGDIDALARGLETVLSNRPLQEAVLARSERYSVRAAREGFVSALEFVGSGRPGRSMR